MSAPWIRRLLGPIDATVRRGARAVASTGADVGRVIYRVVKQLPGAAVILPLAAGILSISLAPSALRLGPFTRGLTGDGATCMIGLLLVCVGAQISPGAARAVGARIVLMLVATTCVTGAAVVGFTRLAPHGMFGITTQALVVAATCTSPALWLAVASRYGRTSDRWAGMVAATINSCPAVPMLVLAVSSGGAESLSARGVADAVVPLLIGVILGRIPGAAASTGRAISLLLVAVSFGLGCQIRLAGLAGAWLPGAALGLGAALAKGGLVAGGWRLVLREPGIVGWAAGACTVAAPLVPQLAAATSPAWVAQVGHSRSELAVAVIVSTLTAPLLVALANHHHARHTRDHSRARDHDLTTGRSDVPHTDATGVAS